MSICIVGAGAIGGLLGTRLAATGNGRVSALARGATLAALHAHGWRLRSGGALLVAPAVASDDAHARGMQDLVVITLKAHALPALARRLGPLIGPDTVVLSAMNGVPWWFCQQRTGADDTPLETVDPHGHTAAAIP